MTSPEAPARPAPAQAPAGPGGVGGRASALLAAPAGALALAAGLSFDGAFQLGAILPLCLACAAAPPLIAAASRLRRGRPRSLLLTVAVSAAAWLAAVPALAARLAAAGAPAAGGLPEILHTGLTSAPKQLLSSQLPAAPAAPLLLAVGTLVWWAAAWSAEAAVRGGAGLLPAFPPGLVLLAGTAAGVPRGSAARLWPAALFLGCLVLLLAGQRALSRPRAPGHPGSGLAARLIRGLLALGITATVTGVAVAAIPLLPGLASRPPADPRQLITPPARAEGLLDPLAAVTAWLSGPPRPLFTVRTATPVNLRWLVLDHYDGTSWTSSARYAPAGQQLPPGPRVVLATRPVRVDISLGRLPGSWLPAPDRPAVLDGLATRVDPASGVLATLDGAPAQGQQYRVTSDIPEYRLRELEGAVPGGQAGLAGQRALPAGLPAAVAAYGARATAHAGYPYQEMVLLQNHLLRDFRYEPKAAPGESYGHLVFFLGGRRTGGPGVFATLFAVLARHAGFPARLAIGFSPGRRSGAGRYQVTTADALVWPEVYFSRLGWIPFYPLPRHGSGAAGQNVRSLGQPPGMAALNDQVARSATGPGGRSRSRARVRILSRPALRSGTPGPGLAALAAVPLLAAAYLAAAAAARGLIRRHRRRDADPRRAVAAAWQETLARLRVAGGGQVTALTPDEVVSYGVTLLGDPARETLATLAGLASQALFSRPPPAAGEVDRARAAAATLDRMARRRTRWRTRAALLWRPVPPRYDRPLAGPARPAPADRLASR